MAQTFWSDYRAEPKRKFNWAMYIGGIPQWIVKATSKPSYEISETAHRYLNHTFKFPGGVTWNDIEIKLVDPINPDASKTIENIIKSAGYNFPTNPNDVTTISKYRAVASLGNVRLEQFDSDGNITEAWVLVNPWIKSVNNGELDYEGEELTELSLTIAYDYAYIDRDSAAGEDQGILPADV